VEIGAVGGGGGGGGGGSGLGGSVAEECETSSALT
jgi:hypothetical protein